MKKVLQENLSKLKGIYKLSLVNNYSEIQDDILEVIVELTKLSYEKPMENNQIPKETPKEEVAYTLIHIDGNGNEYYVYPKREDDFKQEAYEERSVFVRAFHPNGKVEDCVRKVNRIWQSTVLWNINSMFSNYIKDDRGEKLHFSKGKNLKVYACPVSYKDTIPKKIK